MLTLHSGAIEIMYSAPIVIIRLAWFQRGLLISIHVSTVVIREGYYIYRTLMSLQISHPSFDILNLAGKTAFIKPRARWTRWACCMVVYWVCPKAEDDPGRYGRSPRTEALLSDCLRPNYLISYHVIIHHVTSPS
jgi:hypothetical protein